MWSISWSKLAIKSLLEDMPVNASQHKQAYYIYINIYKGKWVGCGVWYLLAWLCTKDLLYLWDKTWPQWADLIVWPECCKKWGVVRGLEQSSHGRTVHVRARLTDLCTTVTSLSHIHRDQQGGGWLQVIASLTCDLLDLQEVHHEIKTTN